MRGTPRRVAGCFVVVCASALVLGAGGAGCGSEEGTTQSTDPDATPGTPEAAAPDSSRPDGSSGTDASDAGKDSGGGDAGDAAADADAEAATPTNDSVWLASSGVLPTAACTAWTLVDTAPNKDPVLSATHATLATDADAENLYYTQLAADLITPATLIVEARVRVASGTSSAASRGPAVVLARYGSPLRTAAFYLTTTEVFLNTADSVKGDAATVATTDAPHTYRIEVNTTTHAIDVKRDNVSVVTGTAYLEPDNGADRVVAWGEGSLLSTGASEWISVTHNAHTLKACP